MSFMSSLRRSTRKNRIPYLVLAIVLAFGLVGSYAFMAIPDANTTGEPSPPEGQAPPEGEQMDTSALEAQIKEYNQILEDNPGDFQALVNLGNSHYTLGNVYVSRQEREQALVHFQEAVNAYRRALNEEPDNNRIRVDLATAAFICGQNQVAEQNFQEAIERDPDFIDARYNYGIFLMQKGDDDAAIEQWQVVLEQNPGELAEQQVQNLIKEARNRADSETSGN